MLGRWLFLTACLPLLGGCWMIGQDYVRPADLPAMPAFRDDAQPPPPDGRADPLDDLGWWTLFGDPVLDDLVREAQTNNYDVRLSVAAVEEARARAGLSESQLYPQVGYNALAAQQEQNVFGGVTPGWAAGGAGVGQVTVSWEIDLWGKIRRANEASLADLLAAKETQAAIRLSLFGQIARAYITLLQLDDEYRVAEETIQSYRETRDLFAARLTSGVDREIGLRSAEARLAAAEAQLPRISHRRVETENFINLLAGRNPGPVPRGAALDRHAEPPRIPAGLPSRLLERRPDLRDAEARLHAATARVGIAEANYFPDFVLTGTAGAVSSPLSKFFTGDNPMYLIMAGLTGPIFTGGALDAKKAQAVAQMEQARLRYAKAILNAFKEVSDILNQREAIAAELDHQSVQVDHLKSVDRLARDRYRAGIALYYEVLLAQQGLYPAQVDRIKLQGQQWMVLIQLYLALGGGWGLGDEQWRQERR